MGSKWFTLGKADANTVWPPPDTDKDMKAYRLSVVRELVQNKKTSIREFKPYSAILDGYNGRDTYRLVDSLDQVQGVYNQFYKH